MAILNDHFCQERMTGMGNGAGEEALKSLMDTLASSDDGSLANANQVMRQADIDYLVSLLQELQRYKEIGTPEECAEYKRKALSAG